ncbi:MAG: hypothetical protein ACLS9Y_14040 [Ruthenibacterium lactatiformans]
MKRYESESFLAATKMRAVLSSLSQVDSTSTRGDADLVQGFLP